MSSQTAHVHLSRVGARDDPDPKSNRRKRRRDRLESTRPQRPAPRMAKSGVKTGRGGSKPPASRMGRIIIALVGFVAVAVGVSMRRVYGVRQAERISELQQRREALVSEQLKLQDAIRAASDRQHLIAIAQSRLNMRLPDPKQVIFLPRRPLARGRDSLTP